MFDATNYYMKKILLAAFIISFGLWSCKKEVTKTDDPVHISKTLCDSSTFNGLVLPIFNANCNITGCHNGAVVGVDFRTYAKAKTAATTKKLMPSIKHELGVSAMPQGSPKLSDRDIGIIQCWVDKGYPEN